MNTMVEYQQIIKSKLETLNYTIFNKSIEIPIIKSILYHLDNNITHIVPIEHFNTNIDEKLILQLDKLPSLIEIKENRYYQTIFPNIRVWTLSIYYRFFNTIITRLFNLYNRTIPIKIWSNIYHHYNNIEIPDTNQRFGSIYIFYTDSDYYQNIEFYQKLINQLKLYFHISIGKQYICLTSLTNYSSKIINKS